MIPWNNGVDRGTIITRDLWQRSGVPDRHKDKLGQFQDVPGPWSEAFWRIACCMAEGPLVILLGARGTGKTQMAVDLMANVCRAGKTVRYAKAMDLFREVRATFAKDGPKEIDVVERICRYGCLVIDEAQERGESEWENRTLTNIIDHRYDGKRATILLSNQDARSFAASVGESVVSRATETGVVVVCDWPSFRKAEK
jgi:DNA replication protein DnaC